MRDFFWDFIVGEEEDKGVGVLNIVNLLLVWFDIVLDINDLEWVIFVIK